MKLINLTPYTINITGHSPIEPSGSTARLHSNLSQVSEVDGIPLLACTNSGVSNLPDPKTDTMYIVASYIRQALPSRKDLASPAKLIRNSGGTVIGCGALEVNP